MAMSVFERVLGSAYAQLPVEIMRVHDSRSRKTLRGRCQVERAKNSLAKLLASIASLPPPAADIPIAVTIAIDDRGEIWARDFDGHVMQSQLWTEDCVLAERLGPIILRFRLLGSSAGIDWRIVGAKCFGIPLPRLWFEGAIARERVENGRYTFDVRAVLPLAGLLVHYRGWLQE